MKYDLAIRWGKRRQAFYLTVRHAIPYFHYVIAPADSYIKTAHFLVGYLIYSILLTFDMACKASYNFRIFEWLL